jgi:hypothetical protein
MLNVIAPYLGEKMLAIVVQKIKFEGPQNEKIVIEAGTRIFVDPKVKIAYYSGIHFDIGEWEYIPAEEEMTH